MEELLIVTTGGTIDKVYFDDKSDFQVGEPQIGRIMEELAWRSVPRDPELRKDSLHIARDRELLGANSAQQARRAGALHDTMVGPRKRARSRPHRRPDRAQGRSAARMRKSTSHRRGAVQSLGGV